MRGNSINLTSHGVGFKYSISNNKKRWSDMALHGLCLYSLLKNARINPSSSTVAFFANRYCELV
jgi:hypothetical protein